MVHNIPQNWIEIPLNEVCEILDSIRIPINSQERAQRIKNIPENDLYPYYGATGQVGMIDGYLFEGEHVLVGEDGAPFLDSFKNKAYLVGGKFWVNNHAHILRSAVSNKYLCYYLNQFDYSKYVTGTTRLKLNQAALKSIPVKFAPRNEQNNIVAKIDELFSELDKGIENLEVAREQLKVYRQAVLKHAFEGKLTAKWRHKNRDHIESGSQFLALKNHQTTRNLDQVSTGEIAQMPIIPSGWQYVRLGYFINKIDAGKSFKCDEREPTPDKIGVAKVSAVSWGEYDEAESKTCTNPKYINPDFFIQTGDFLFSRANTIDLVGACVIVQKVTKRIMLSDKTLRIKFDHLNPHYFLFYLRSQSGRKEIMHRSTGNQESMRNIGQERIRNIIIPICSSQEAEIIQQQIKEQFLLIDKLQEIIAFELQRSETLKLSVLKRAFSGKLVAQDPNDEPASLLLERIRSDKELQKADRKKPLQEREKAHDLFSYGG